MPIKSKIKAQNFAKIDENAYAIAKLIDISEVDFPDEKSEKSQLEFVFSVVGSQKDFVLKFWTGTTISSIKYQSEKASKPAYSKLTQLCLNLELFTEKELISDDIKIAESLHTKLDNLIGESFKFKLKSNKKGFSVIDGDTIRLA